MKICFVIANKYIRGYNSYMKTYLYNINTFYKDSFILIVDNNSNFFKEDIHIDYENVKVITNTSDSKFELGAYNFGISYLLENNIVNNYDYYVFTQDTFILTKYYDFTELLKNNVMASPIVGSREGCFLHDHTNGIPHHRGHKDYYLIRDVISKLNLIDSADKLTFCLSNSFILNKSKLFDFLELTKNIKIENKMHSESSERFLAGVLYVLNNNMSASIEKKVVEEVMNLLLCFMPLEFDYFTKYIHYKTELTEDK